jgi:CheY-like chemotaxis protein
LNGDEALQFYRKRGPYDLVLTDIQHPGPNGIEVVKRIRETNPAQAIAMVSGFGGSQSEGTFASQFHSAKIQRNDGTLDSHADGLR